MGTLKFTIRLAQCPASGGDETEFVARIYSLTSPPLAGRSSQILFYLT